jgi:hypothetical protein
MNRVLKMDNCRALRELKGQQPLTESEYQRLDQLAEECPLVGEHFDEVSTVYPLQIPIEPKVRLLDETNHIVSVVVLLNRNQYVGVIGDKELEDAYLTYPGGFLYCVGELEKKIKGEMTFWNLRPRGWKVYPLSPKDVIMGENAVKKKRTHE